MQQTLHDIEELKNWWKTMRNFNFANQFVQEKEYFVQTKATNERKYKINSISLHSEK